MKFDRHEHRYFNPVALFKSLFGGGKTENVTAPNPTPTPAQTVDAGGKLNTDLGRAALISTSPQGVQGTDPTGRKRLFGN